MMENSASELSLEESVQRLKERGLALPLWIFLFGHAPLYRCFQTAWSVSRPWAEVLFNSSLQQIINYCAESPEQFERFIELLEKESVCKD